MSEPTPIERLRATQAKLIDNVIVRYEDGEWWRFAINLVLVVGGGLLAAIAKLGFVSATATPWLTGIGLVMVFVGGALVAIFDRRRTKLTTSARDALDLAQAFLDQQATLEARIQAAELLDTRRRYLLQAQQVMQEAVERIPQGTDIKTVVEAMLDAGSADLEGAIGFDAGEKWTFSVFRREPLEEGGTAEVMRRIAFSWADRSSEKRIGREWRKKEGFTGVSWQRDDEVIEADVTLPEIADQYPVPTAQRRDGDDKRYVSVAVIPIRVGSGDEMWGSVTATSDQAGRWRRVASDPREQNVQAVRVLAQLIAMQVALRRSVP